MLVTVSINMEFKHPKYYKELRKRNKPAGTGGALCVDPEAGSDQAISDEASTEATSVRPGPGLKQQASSNKQQASSAKRIKQQAASIKPQATSVKLQATSGKLQDS